MLASFGQVESRYWRYFLSIERDLSVSRQFCELSQRNYASFSDEYAKIIILSSIHFEFVAKAFLKEKIVSPNLSNISKIRQQLMQLRPGIATIKIPLPSAGIDASPLVEWGNSKTPAWWSAYTKLKHDFGGSRHDGNQINAINALSACMCMLLYFLEGDIPRIDPHPELLYYDRPPYLLGYAEPYQTLP